MLLSFGAGSIALFAFVLGRFKPVTRDWLMLVYPMPLVSIALCIAACALLVRYNRRESPKRATPWHLSLTDFCIAMTFAGLCMALSQTIWPDYFLYWGAALSVGAGAGLLAGVLVAQSRGYARNGARHSFAFWLALKWFGALAWGWQLSLVVWSAIFDGVDHGLQNLRWSLLEPSQTVSPFMAIAGGVALPLGLLMCYLFPRLTSRK